MNKLIVRHLHGSNPSQFQLERVVDGKTAEPVEVPSPIEFPVEGRPDSHLMLELRWYLEQFLDWPFPPLTDRAERVLESLHKWGKRAFEALFGGRWAGRLFDAATHEEYSQLHLEIASDDPKILYWPWEGLCDPEVGVLARTCQISRRLNKVRDPHPLAKDLPQDRINILLITARPYESDVQFRSISRPLIDLIAKEKLPANVTLLRPPTLDQLRTHLREHPHHYHILHFDGHGAYGKKHGHDDPHSLTMQGPIGELVFEDLNGAPDPQSASVLSELLREYHIPIVVLNACQSAMVDETAEDAFASVAAALQKSGVRSVVAMAYSLYVSGAQQFLPAFYRRLFQDGIVADAVRAGRQQAFAHPQRRCARGEFPLKDWLVPVLYEQQPVALKFRSTLAAAPSHSTPDLPAAALDRENPYGFVGRDGAVLQLERAMQRPPAAVLIHGFGGTGKTTLCRGFVHWMAATGGLGCGFIWFSFQEIRSAEFVINELTAKLFGTNALATATDQKILDLTTKLRDNKFVIVWDNFEVVCGIAATSHQPTLTEEDRAQLLDLLKQLRGGKTKVLITSRSPETWIDSTTCFRLPIGGLKGEERWEFCDVIVRDLGLTVDRNRSDWAKLMELLEGHPLAMRVILPRLQQSSPARLAEALKENLLQFESQDIESAKLFATLRFALEQLDSELQRLLIPLGMLDHFADIKLVNAMATDVQPPFSANAVDRLFAVLVIAGLLRHRGDGIYDMHPMLGQFLQLTVLNRADEVDLSRWIHSFVQRMSDIALYFGVKELHEQRVGFHIHGSNMRRALNEAKRLRMDALVAALTESLAVYALNARRFQEAQNHYEDLADHHHQRQEFRSSFKTGSSISSRMRGGKSLRRDAGSTHA